MKDGAGGWSQPFQKDIDGHVLSLLYTEDLRNGDEGSVNFNY